MSREAVNFGGNTAKSLVGIVASNREVYAASRFLVYIHMLMLLDADINA